MVSIFFYMCVHHQLGFQQHQTSAGVEILLHNSPKSGKMIWKCQKKTSAPRELTTLSTSCRCFMVFWCNVTIKILLTAFLNILNLFFLLNLSKLFPEATPQNISLLPRTSSCNPGHTGTASSVAACGHRSPASLSPDDDAMTPN